MGPHSDGARTGFTIEGDSMKYMVAVLCAVFCTTMAIANPANDRLKAMPPEKRAGALALFLQQSGEKCPSVSRTFYQGSGKNGDAFWDATCAGGKSWAIQVKNDSVGSTRILDCAVMKALHAGTCFSKFPDSAD